MQPSIISPVPTILFSGGSVTIKARYNSETGAPMQQCGVGVATKKTTVAGTVSVDGEVITGVVQIIDIEQADGDWRIGDDLSVVVRTMENGSWSETRFTAKTCGEPDVVLTSGHETLSSFPHAVTWDYGDGDGFWQCGWKLTVSGSRLMGEVSISSYTNAQEAIIDGSEIAYAADVGGALPTLDCVLEVISTSGASRKTRFRLSVSGGPAKPNIAASVDDGRLLIESTEPFQLYAIGSQPTRAAYSDSGVLLFDLPDASTRLFAVTLDESKIGRGDELFFSGPLGGYIDYTLDGGKRRLDVGWEGKESALFSSDVELVHFAGRRYPVSYTRDATGSFSLSCVLDDGEDAVSVCESIKGLEAVYRPQFGGVFRIVVNDASSSIGDDDGIPSVSLSVNIVDGSPYALIYDDPWFEDVLLYPGDRTYPGDSTYPRR